MSGNGNTTTVQIPSWLWKGITGIIFAMIPMLLLWVINLEYRVRDLERLCEQNAAAVQSIETIKTDMAVIKNEMIHITDGHDELKELLREYE